MRKRILIADDQQSSRSGLNALLSTWGYEVEDAGDGKEALEKVRAFSPEVVVADLVMPNLDGLELLKALQEDLPFCMVIILTAHGTVETAVSAMKQGAYDYLTKPVDVPRLRILIEKALEKAATLREMSVLRRRVREVWGFGKLVGTSPVMQDVYRFIELVAPTQAPVLILGESGTGKELVARSLHELSPRSQEPFVAVNCSAFPETLFESEIFGHERGAFTGALARKMGCFELAHGGTIFLDEVAEMPPAMQAKFLRVLQDGKVRPLGNSMEVQVDVRVLAATNKDAVKALNDKTLRDDLYYRLNVCSVTVPPLRDRREDIPLLAQAFLEEFNEKYGKHVNSIDDAALAILMDSEWSGNVREFRNTIERAMILCESDVLSPRYLPRGAVARGAGEGIDSTNVPVGITVEAVERQLIMKTLSAVNHNKTRAAQLLGISPKTLYNKLKHYGIQDSCRS